MVFCSLEFHICLQAEKELNENVAFLFLFDAMLHRGYIFTFPDWFKCRS